MKKSILVKIIAAPFLIFALFCVCALFGVFFDDRSVMMSSDLVEVFIMIIAGSICGGAFFLAGCKRDNRPRVFWWMMLATSAVYAVILFFLLYGNVSMMRKNANIKTYSLVPLKTIKNYFMAYKNNTINKSTVIDNIFGNLVVFCPAGYIIPFFIRKARKLHWFCLIMLVILCMVEFVQFLTGRGNMDIDDVILNFLGAVIFFFLTWNRLVTGWMTKLGLYKEA